MAALALRSLRKHYPDGVTAVADVSLDVADAEFVVRVGPSGCGKSMTLRRVAGWPGWRTSVPARCGSAAAV